MKRREKEKGKAGKGKWKGSGQGKGRGGSNPSKQKFWLQSCLLLSLWCNATFVCLYCSNCT